MKKCFHDTSNIPLYGSVWEKKWNSNESQNLFAYLRSFFPVLMFASPGFITVSLGVIENAAIDIYWNLWGKLSAAVASSWSDEPLLSWSRRSLEALTGYWVCSNYGNHRHECWMKKKKRSRQNSPTLRRSCCLTIIPPLTFVWRRRDHMWHHLLSSWLESTVELRRSPPAGGSRS